MPYVWGTTEGLTWGNAVLSRYPITASEAHALPTEDLLLERGFILAQIDTGTANPLNVINTHYHHIEADSDLRVPQSQAIIDFWAGRPFTLIMGDLNAEPDTPEMMLIRDAGFTEALAAAGITPGYTYSSVDPYTQLDYIWYTADLAADGVIIPTTTASDHLGIVATISGE
jgi:endonuclease/exonuclease/phosphatase family metal-dependent hydrolase